MNKIILKDDEYAIVINPYDKESKSLIFGDREVRKGPMILSLRPGETLDKTRQVGMDTFKGKKIDGKRRIDNNNIIDLDTDEMDDSEYYKEDPYFNGRIITIHNFFFFWLSYF